jgi:hypothetical protein
MRRGEQKVARRSTAAEETRAAQSSIAADL